MSTSKGVDISGVFTMRRFHCTFTGFLPRFTNYISYTESLLSTIHYQSRASCQISEYFSEIKSGLEIKTFFNEPNCIFISFIKVLCISNSTSVFVSRKRVQGSPGLLAQANIQP